MSARVVRQALSGTARLLALTAAFVFASSQIVVVRLEAGADALGQSSTLSRILNNWKARAERARSLHFISTAYMPTFRSAPIPFRLEFWLQGENHFCYVLSNSNPRLTTMARRRSFDGLRSADVEWVSGPSGGGMPQAYVTSGIDQAAPREDRLVPALLTFRPFWRGSRTLRPESLRLVTENALRDHGHYIKLQSVNERGAIVEQFWVDAARDDIIVFWQRTSSGANGIAGEVELSIRYAQDPKHGWLPTQWTLNDSGFTVGGARFTFNAELPAETFVPTFPPRTMVFDKVNDEEYVTTSAGSKPPAADLEVFQALRIESNLKFESEPLSRVLERIHQRFKIPITIDKQAMSAADIDLQVKIVTQNEKISLRELLNRILMQSPKPIQYEVRDGRLVIEPRLPLKKQRTPRVTSAPAK